MNKFCKIKIGDFFVCKKFYKHVKFQVLLPGGVGEIKLFMIIEFTLVLGLEALLQILIV